MQFGFRCPETGLPDFCESDTVKCPYCRQMHKAYPVGVSRKKGVGFNTPPPIRPFHSTQHGCKITSMSDWKKKNREMDLVDTGEKLSGYVKPNRAVFYPGQGVRKSTAERT